MTPTCEKKTSSTSIALALLTGAGLAATAFLLAKRLRKTNVAATVEHLIDRCDEAATALDERIRHASHALAG
jgi:hypothetical protein